MTKEEIKARIKKERAHVRHINEKIQELKADKAATLKAIDMCQEYLASL
jgi:hypothetical protein